MSAPPRAALSLLRLFCRRERRVEVEGDLLEAFDGWTRAHGPGRASLRLWREILMLPAWWVVGKWRGVRGGGMSGAGDPSTHRPFRGLGGDGRGFLSDAWRDLAYALRRLGRSPGSTAVAILILAIGVGGNTTIFTIVDALFVEPPPLISDPGELVGFDARVPEFGYYDFLFYREHGEAFQDVIAYGGFPGTQGRNPKSGGEIAVGRGDNLVQAQAWVVSTNYFQVLGVPVTNGSGFTGRVGEPQLDHPEVVLSYGFWRRQFGADPSVTERPLVLNGIAFRVVGITPREFRGVNPTDRVPDLYIPIMAAGAISSGFDDALTRYSESGEPQASRFVRLVGRLKPGMGVETAEAEMEVLQHRWESEFTAWAEAVYGQPYRVRIRSEFHLAPSEARRLRQMLTFLWFVVGSVFLIACTNLAILLLARAAGREREMGIRAALGAGRGRLLRQLLTESLILSAIGGVLGVGVAFVATDAAAVTLPLSVAFDLSPDATVVTFALLLATLAALLFGTAPAWMLSSLNVVETLQRPGQGRARSLLRGGLVAGQTALSIVLLIVGGLFARSLQEARKVQLGFEAEHKLLMSVVLDNHGYSQEQGLEFITGVLDRLERVPGVQAVTTANRMPFRPRNSWTFIVPGTEYAEEGLWAGLNLVGPDYFTVLEIPVIAGRAIDRGDRQSTQRVAMVNRVFADRMWPGQSPLGKTLPLLDTEFTVVGVAETSVYWRLGEDPVPFVYFPNLQLYSGRMTFHVATGPEPMALAGAAERAMREFDPNLAIAVNTVGALRDEQLSSFRIWATFVALFSGIALFLAMVGLYGVQSFLVARRTREIGIRMALGATAGSVIGRVVLGSLVMGGVGAIVGVAVALGLGGLVQGFLFGVTPHDPVVYVVVSAALLGACLVASLFPAARAASVNPVQALSQE